MKVLHYNILQWLMQAGAPAYCFHTSFMDLRSLGVSTYVWKFETHMFRAIIFRKMIEMTKDMALVAEMSMTNFNGESVGPYICRVFSDGYVSTQDVTWCD